MIELDTLLAAIGSQGPSDFNELCRGLGGDVPQSTGEWAELFRLIEQAERDDLVEVSRIEVDKRMRIDTIILTPSGADRIRGKLDAERGLFGLME